MVVALGGAPRKEPHSRAAHTQESHRGCAESQPSPSGPSAPGSSTGWAEAAEVLAVAPGTGRHRACERRGLGRSGARWLGKERTGVAVRVPQRLDVGAQRSVFDTSIENTRPAEVPSSSGRRWGRTSQGTGWDRGRSARCPSVPRFPVAIKRGQSRKVLTANSTVSLWLTIPDIQRLSPSDYSAALRAIEPRRRISCGHAVTMERPLVHRFATVGNRLLRRPSVRNPVARVLIEWQAVAHHGGVSANRTASGRPTQELPR